MNKEILEGAGYKALSTGTPAEAIRLAGEHPGGIDLLLTDVIMPQMNGQELASNIRLLCPDIKCLLTSGYSYDVISPNGALDAGVHFLQKPFSVQALRVNVLKALEQE